MGRTLVEEDDLMIEGCLTTRKNPVDRTKSSSKGQGIFRDRSSIGARLHAADTAESSFTDLVISRDGSSARSGARSRDHQGSRPRVQGSACSIRPGHRRGSGCSPLTQDSAGVTVYTEKDYLHSHRDKRGVLILAPNFIDPQGDVNFAPATSISRPGYTKIKPDRFGGLRNLHVKGSLIIDTFVCLDQSIVPPLRMVFRDRQHEWYRPPNGVIAPKSKLSLGWPGPEIW
ncbi:hypothetical protein Q5P01_000044 [Channa striata]|uniref:Uncharacterized protein n=1 Tax=Channa striata TaxID=64152 RepID=A0AA88IHI0_CHASR|nr:hypothetical protein Q5P01_000044 [Channa striata]